MKKIAAAYISDNPSLAVLKALRPVITHLTSAFDKEKRESQLYLDMEKVYGQDNLLSALEYLSIKQYELAHTFALLLKDKGHNVTPASTKLLQNALTEIQSTRAMLTAREGMMEVRYKSVNEVKNRLLDTFA